MASPGPGKGGSRKRKGSITVAASVSAPHQPPFFLLFALPFNGFTLGMPKIETSFKVLLTHLQENP